MKFLQCVVIICAVFIITGCTVQTGLPVGCPAPLAAPSASGSGATLNPAPTNPVPTTDAPGSIPVRTVYEGELVSFPNLKVTDPEGAPITLSYSFPLDENGQWQTETGDAGEYVAKITASDGTTETEQKVKIVVLKKNDPPTLSLPATISAKEGDMITLEPQTSDPNGDAVTVSYKGWMSEATKEASFDDAGNHEVIVTASDGDLKTEKTITVKIEDVNRAPVISQLQDVVVSEGDTITAVPRAMDPDNDPVTFIYSAPFDEKGVFATKKGDAGKYRSEIVATDGKLNSSTKFFVVIEAVNLPPVIENFGNLTVDEGDIVVLNPRVTDEESDKLTLTYSGWMTKDTYQTTYSDAGVHEVNLTVTDGTHTVAQTVTVTVNNINRPPQFGAGSFT